MKIIKVIFITSLILAFFTCKSSGQEKTKFCEQELLKVKTEIAIRDSIRTDLKNQLIEDAFKLNIGDTESRDSTLNSIEDLARASYNLLGFIEANIFMVIYEAYDREYDDKLKKLFKEHLSAAYLELGVYGINLDNDYSYIEINDEDSCSEKLNINTLKLEIINAIIEVYKNNG